MLNEYEKVHYVVHKITKERCSKFYSRRGDADRFMNQLQKWDWDVEAVTMYCVPLIEAVK